MTLLQKLVQIVLLWGVMTLAAPAVAQTNVEPANAIVASGQPVVGPVTNLPLPRYVSLKVAEGNVRRGPSLSHRIDWVFTRRDMPLQIVAEYGHWRRVVDRDGLGGWIHFALLSGHRTVIVDQDREPLYARPDLKSQQNAQVEAGVIAELGECKPDWCWINAGGFGGWVPKAVLWGVDPAELRD